MIPVASVGNNSDNNYRAEEGLDDDLADLETWNVEAFVSLRAHVESCVAQGIAEPSIFLTPAMVVDNMLYAFKKSTFDGAETVIVFASEKNECKDLLPNQLVEKWKGRTDFLPFLNIHNHEIARVQSVPSDDWTENAVGEVNTSVLHDTEVLVTVWATKSTMAKYIVRLSINFLRQWTIDSIRLREKPFDTKN